MHSPFKEDVEAARQRMDAWWDREALDRPAIGYFCPRDDVPFRGIWDMWYLAKHHDDIDGALDDFERKAECIIFGGENVPTFFPNYGPGIMACVLGAEATYYSGTAWFHRKTTLDEILPLLESAPVNGSNPWYARLVTVTERAARRAGDRYQVAQTDLGGVLDVLASFLEPKDIFHAMRTRPGLVDACRAVILEKLLKVYDALQRPIDEHCHGCSAWLPVWCRKHWYPIQCDFSYMLSPKWFTRFVLPDIKAQAEHMDYAIYHLDGVNQLPFLDEILALDAVTGIQWVPGAGKPTPGEDAWMHVFKKIQAAGKNIVGTDVLPENIARMYNELDPKGLHVVAIIPAKVIADFCLPAFAGGMGGVEDDGA